MNTGLPWTCLTASIPDVKVQLCLRPPLSVLPVQELQLLHTEHEQNKSSFFAAEARKYFERVQSLAKSSLHAEPHCSPCT